MINRDMELLKVRGGTEEELYQKKYTIGVGISLGSKWFTAENIVGATRWALEHTRDVVVVYVADSIHAINLKVRKRISYEKALKLSMEMGNEILSEVEESIKRQLPAKYISRIKFSRWAGLLDEKYIAKKDFLYEMYEKDVAFKNAIRNLVRNYVSKDKRSFSDGEIDYLGTYILEELPEVMCRVQIDGIACDAYAYPFDGELTKLVEKIQQGDVFPEIKERILDTKPKVFLEVR